MKFNFRMFLVVLSCVFLSAGCSKDSSQTIEQLTSSAVQQLQAGQIEKAESNAQQALKIVEEEKGLQHPAAVQPLQVLALVYQSRGEYAKAAESYERAINIAKTTNGEKSIAAAQLMNNLAGLYYTQQEYEKAIAVFQQSLAIAKANLPEGDPNILKIEKNIAKCKSALGDDEVVAEIDETKKLDENPFEDMPASASKPEIPDLVPAQVKESTLKDLARQNIYLYDLRPMSPVKIGSGGVVLPYRCTQKMTESDEGGVEAVLLFSAVKNPDKVNAFVFKKCRMVSYESYVEELKKQDPASLEKALKEVFPGVYS